MQAFPILCKVEYNITIAIQHVTDTTFNCQIQRNTVWNNNLMQAFPILYKVEYNITMAIQHVTDKTFDC